MKRVARELTGEFVILDLGSAHSQLLEEAGEELCRTLVLIEVDPAAKAPPESSPFHRRVVIPNAIAGTAGRRTFHARRYPQCSSFLAAKAELVKAYGLESYFEEVETIDFDCVTVPDVLEKSGVPQVDFFKTDLEGLDFEVLRSAVNHLSNSLLVQSELRFQPFFEGEGSFCDSATLLKEAGFELISLRPHYWKYATPHRTEGRDGRIVWADCIFAATADRVLARTDWKAAAKQIILLKLVGLHNVAEQRFSAFRSLLPDFAREEVQEWIKPQVRVAWFAANLVGSLPGGNLALGGLRRFFRWGYEAACRFPDDVLAAPQLPH